MKVALRDGIMDSSIFPIYMCTPQYGTVYMSARQEIKDFQFNPKPIGMEIEYKNHKLICVNVKPKSQSSFFREALKGAEVIAVQNHRTMSLHQFVDTLRAEMESLDGKSGFISLTMSSFCGGRLKIDSIMQFGKKKKSMKGLFSSLMTKGVDKDKYDDVELPAKGSKPIRKPSSESDDDTEEEEDEEGKEEEEVVSVGKNQSVSDLKQEETLEVLSIGSAKISENIEPYHELDDAWKSDSESEATLQKKGALMDESVASSSVCSSKKKFMQKLDSDSDDESKQKASYDDDSYIGSDQHSDTNSLNGDNNAEDASVNVGPAETVPVDLDLDPVPIVSDIQAVDAASDGIQNQADIPPVKESLILSQDEKEHQCASVDESNFSAENETSDSIINSGEHKVIDAAAITDVKDESDSDGDDNSPLDEELIAKFKQQSSIITETIEEIVTGEEAPIVLEEEDKDDGSSEEDEPGDMWDYATAMQDGDYAPYRTLVCVPPNLKGTTNGWGDPKGYLHFANFSQCWYLEIFWVDHEGLLVPRVKLKNGERHNEMTGENHVWCIIASYIEKKNRRKGKATDDEDLSVGGESVASVIPGRSNTMIIFRSSGSLLTNARSTFLSWIPWYSVAFSQRSRLTFITERMKATQDAIADPPHLNIHIFDKFGTENI